MNSRVRYCGGIALIFVVLFLLCLPFMSNPLFFDDQYFFQPGNPSKFLNDGVHIYPRWWVYETFAASYIFLGVKVFWLRFENLLLHFGVVLALGSLLRALLRDIDKRVGLSASVEWVVFFAVALFAVHPLAIFTQGYLIQRTIVCATLFSLLSLAAFWRGLAGSYTAMFFSCLFFALALYAKEHVVMLPVVAFLLLVLRWRSGLYIGLPLNRVLLVLLFHCLLALLVVFQVGGIIGTPYEILTGEILEGEESIPPGDLYPLSVINQAGLFFHYLLLWAFPFSDSVSVDMRPVFPLDFTSWIFWVGVAGFFAFVVMAARLLWCGGVRGLLGFSLLAPAILFFTEFSAVRLQEPFVIYRSYLWGGFFVIAFALALRLFIWRMALLAFLFVFLIFTGCSFLRLQTFSHPVLVWQEAADVYEAGSSAPGVFGGYRIYYNLGTELNRAGESASALVAFNRAIELKPGYGWSWNNRGAVFLGLKNYSAAQADYVMAAKLLPESPMPWRGLARALEAQGGREQAEKARQAACVLGGQAECGGVKPSGL